MAIENSGVTPQGIINSLTEAGWKPLDGPPSEHPNTALLADPAHPENYVLVWAAKSAENDPIPPDVLKELELDKLIQPQAIFPDDLKTHGDIIELARRFGWTVTHDIPGYTSLRAPDLPQDNQTQRAVEIGLPNPPETPLQDGLNSTLRKDIVGCDPTNA